MRGGIRSNPISFWVHPQFLIYSTAIKVNFSELTKILYSPTLSIAENSSGLEIVLVNFLF